MIWLILDAPEHPARPKGETRFMKHDLRSIVHRSTHALEAVIGFLLTIAVILAVIGVVVTSSPIELLHNPEIISDYIHIAATVVLAIEFVNMLCTHTLDSVVEVVLMVVARQMIVNHGTPVENLICCVSIALLFVVRKFLFVSYLDKIDYHDTLLHEVAHLFHKSKEREEPAKAEDEANEKETASHH